MVYSLLHHHTSSVLRWFLLITEVQRAYQLDPNRKLQRRHSFRPIHYVFFLQKINTQKSSVFISCIRIRNYKHKLESACFGRESDPRLALTSGLFAEIGTALNSGNKRNILTR